MRVSRGIVARRRHKAMLERAEGTWGTRHASYRIARQTVIRAGQYAFRDRKNKKRDFRKLWIARINAAVRAEGYTYSSVIHKMNEKNIQINRKMLSELAINHPDAFKELLKDIMG